MAESDQPKVDIEAFRSALFGMVGSVAAGGTTETCGYTTFYLDYLNEFLCMWFDDLYWRPAELVTDGVITQSEREILDRMNDVIRRAYPKGSEQEVVDINLLQKDPNWLEVVRAANQAEHELREMNR